MDIQELKHRFLNREQKEGYEDELVQYFGIKFGFDIACIASLTKMQFLDVAIVVTQDKRYAKLVESGYRLYEYVKPR